MGIITQNIHEDINKKFDPPVLPVSLRIS